MSFDLAELEARLKQRAMASPEESYTAKLVASGIGRVSKKLGEEATETVIAALVEDDKALTGEAADLLYHLLVLLIARSIPLDAVMAELERRTAQSGLAEKAARPRGGV